MAAITKLSSHRPHINRLFQGFCRLGGSSKLAVAPLDYVKLPRLYVDQKLVTGGSVDLENEDVHYLVNVMRCKVGSMLRIFNGESGEYLCMIDRVSGTKSQRKVSFNILELRKSVHDVIPPSVFLIAAPIKKQRMKIMVEKATELNAHTIIPLITQNVNNSVDISTLQRSIVQATEQGERLVPPLLANAAHIKDFFDEDGYIILKTATDKYILNYLVCSARSDLISHYVEPLHRALSTICTDRSSTDSFLAASPLAVIIGPEGGFTSSEMQLFEGKKNVKFVSLGQNVLRSETAALAALAVIQMLSR